MPRRLYVETTVVSYLTARPTRDLVLAARQEITRQWWEKRSQDFELFASELVLSEASKGDPEAAVRRIGVVEQLTLLDINDDVAEAAAALIEQGSLPERAADDAVHLALSAFHGMDFLLTWNCRHLANAELAAAAASVLRARGFRPPVVCTPDVLMGT